MYNNIIWKRGLSVLLTFVMSVSLCIYSGTPLSVKAADIPRTNAEINADNVMAVAKAYDPDGAYFLQTTSDKGNDYTVWWVSGDKITTSMNTAVHESFHQVSTDTILSHDDYYRVGVGEEDIVVSKTDVFLSDEMWSSIPDSLKNITHAKRGTIYIEGTSDAGKNMYSIQGGIYGILQEYTAYSWGTHTDVQLIDYVESHDDISWDDFSGYIGCLANDVEAGGEFTYFAMEYLAYAKENYPDKYDNLKANADLCKALKQTSERTHDCIEAIGNDVLPRLVTAFDAAGYKSYYKDSEFGVMFPKAVTTSDGKMSSGGAIGLYYDSYYAYMEALQTEPYKSIAEEFGMNISYSRIEATEDPHDTYMHDPSGNLVKKSETGSSTTTEVVVGDETGGTTDGGNTVTTSSVFELNASNVTKLENVSGGIRLTWERSDSASRYEIYRFDQNGKNKKKIADISGGEVVTYTDTSVTTGKGYIYQIYSYGTPPYEGSEEIYSTGAKSDVMVWLKAPKLKTLKKKGTKRLIAAWGKISGAGGYQIEYSLKQNFSGKKRVNVGKAKTTKKVLTKLKSKKKYYVHIRTYKKLSGKTFYSDWSNVKSAKVK